MDNVSLLNDMESTYNFGISVNWNVEQMLEYGRLHGYSYEFITKLALSYVEHKGNYNEYKNLVGIFNSQDIIGIDNEHSDFNPVLFRKGIKTYRLWLDDEQEKLVLKYIYDAWKNTNISKERICDLFHIDNNKLNRLLFIYACDYLKMSFEEWDEEDKKITDSKISYYSRSKGYYVLKRLLKLKNDNEIIDVINSSGFTAGQLRPLIHNYLIIYEREHYDEYKTILDNALNLYKDYRTKERKEKQSTDMTIKWQKYVEDTLPGANKLVEDFINSNYDNVKSYVDANYVNFEGKLSGVQIFKKCLELVKKYNEELYIKYREKIDGKQSQIYAVIAENIKKMIILIKNGVIENDIKRPFDLIDYYQITKLSFDDILKIAKTLLEKKAIEVKDYYYLVNFAKINKSGEKVVYSDIKRILNEKQEINCEKNNKGYPIPGTGEIIRDDIKNKLIEYLKQYGVPINYRTYHIAFNRYKNGLIDLNAKKY